jgi:DNA polymerase-1
MVPEQCKYYGGYNIMLVDTQEKFEQVIPALLASPRKAIDVETNGLDAFGINQLCGVGIAIREDETFYFPFRHQQGTNLPTKALYMLMGVVSQSTEELLGYNLKFDLRFLENEGLVVDRIDKLIDVIVMVRLIESSTVTELGLTPTIKRRYGPEAANYDIDTKKVLRSNKWSKDFSMAPSEILGPYCEQDVYWTYRLFNDCYKKIKKSDQLDIFNLECQLTRVLYDMECRGVAVDKAYASKSKVKVEKRRLEVAEEIYALAGKEFAIQSPQQVGEIFNALGIHSPVMTPGGKESWSELALIGINHLLAGLIRQYRALGKLQSTYIEPYTNIDILHTQYCNWGALTGRLSSRSPNLQNIPRNHFKLTYKDLSEEERLEVKERIASSMSAKGLTRIGELDDAVLDTWGFMGDKSFNESDEYQIAIRRTFVPREEYTLVAFDYSQMEVRVFLSYLNNAEIDSLLEKNDVDFHAEAAKLAFNVTEDSPDFSEKRQLAKNITFGTIYGIGTKRLALQLQSNQYEAAQYKKKYFAGLKGSKDFFDTVMSTVADRGWIRNRYGRIYKIPSDFSYKGVNYLVQGTAADILNERIIKVHEFLKDKKSSILMQVHDEIICEIHDSELDTLPDILKRLLEENSLGIPLSVDMEVCEPSWATKRDYYTTQALDYDSEEAELEMIASKTLASVDFVEDYIDWS